MKNRKNQKGGDNDPSIVQPVPLSPGVRAHQELVETATKPKWLKVISGRAQYRLQLLGHGINSAFRREHELGILINLFPVFLAFGICIYYSAGAEPLLFPVAALGVVLMVALQRSQTRGAGYLLLYAFTAVSLGMLASKMSVMRIEAPIIERQITAVATGDILAVDQNRAGSPRLLLKIVAVDGIEPSDLPERLRLSMRTSPFTPAPGDRISGLARIFPVSGPVYPGGYDFSFFAWSRKQGGTGFFMGAPEKVGSSTELTWTEHALVSINQLRSSIEARIVQSLPSPASEVAVALITGDKSRIPEDIQQSLRDTGLAHILAISGLHMALVTLTIIAFARLCFASIPDLALRHPVRKWSVWLGAISATVYLFLSGFGIATQRAWIMIMVMLLAILLDRRAITMRSVAVSASLILLISPHSLFAPGFQMSFAAVAALVSGYEAINRWRLERLKRDDTQVPAGGFVKQSVRKISAYTGGMILTSLIAGTATGFIAAWHFHQIASLGLLANILAMPIIAFLVMPAVLFSMLLMPFGLEALTLWPAGQGIEAIVAISQWVASLTPVILPGSLTEWAIGAFGICIVLTTVLRSRLWLTGPILAAIIALMYSTPQRPDLLVSENGLAIAIKQESGELALVYPARNKFTTEIWRKTYGQSEIKGITGIEEKCGKEVCILKSHKGRHIHVVYNPDLIASSCNRADILIAPRLWWVNCRERKPDLILARDDFEQNGMHALYIPSDAVSPVTIATGLGGNTRPWHRKVRPKAD